MPKLPVTAPRSRTNIDKYHSAIIDYFSKRKGHIIVLSHDNTFVTLVQMLVVDDCGGVRAGCMTLLSNPTQMLRVLEKVYVDSELPVIFIERLMGGHDLTFLVRQFKEAFPDIRIIVLSADVSKDRLMLLHEMGADYCLAKPVSMLTLLEKTALTIKPQTKVGQMVDSARTLLGQGRAEEALSVCRKLLELKPNNAPGYLVLGDVWRTLNDFEQARQAYELALSHADMFLTPLRRLADLAREAGEEETRLLFLYRMDDLSPLNVERKMEMGEIHLHLGQTAEAERLFEKALFLISREASSQIACISERIASLYSKAMPHVAEKYLRKSLDARSGYLSTEDIGTFNLLGISLRQQGRWEDALAEYHKAEQLSPEDSRLHYNMGMACMEGKDSNSAVKHMHKALVLNPRLPYSGANIAYNMGLIFLQEHDTNKGIQCIKVALEQNPRFEEAHSVLRRYS